MDDLILKLLEPDTLNQILGGFVLVLYLTGRITKNQFRAEQMKVKGIIQKAEARRVSAEKTLGPIKGLFDVMNMIPILNTKIPFINQSVPDILNGVGVEGIAMIGDLLHNLPDIGTNIKKDEDGQTDNNT